MTPNSSELSKCCKAEAKDHLSIRYPDKTAEELRGKTNYFLCMKCQQPCDVQEPTQNCTKEIPENLRKAFEEKFPEGLLTRGEADYDAIYDVDEQLLEFIHFQREEAVKEVIERLTLSGESQNRAGFKEGLVILEEADSLRKIFLPTSNNTKEHEA